MKKLCFMIFVLILFPVVLANSGSMKLMAVTNPDDNPRGSVANMFLEIEEGTGRIFIDSYPLSKLDTQISTRFAKEVACNYLEKDCSRYDFFYTIRSDSSLIGGPSAGAATTVLTMSVLENIPLDDKATMTGTINTGGIIGPVGSIVEKTRAAAKSGIETIIIPRSNMQDVLIDEKYESMVTVIPVDSLDEVLKHALVGSEEKVSLVERLSLVIDTISNSGDTQPSA